MLFYGRKRMDFWLDELHTSNVGLRIKIREKVFEGTSPYQRVEILDSYEYGKMMLLDGTIMFTERDEYFYHEMMAHIPLFSCDHPEKVLIVGGGDGGVINQILKHPHIDRIDLVEIDRMVIDVSRCFFPELSKGLDDHRVNIRIENGSTFLQDKKDEYDVLIIDSTDPETNKPSGSLYESGFYQNCFDALNDSGVMGAQIGSPLYTPDLIRRTFQNLREIFPLARPFIVHVPTYSNGIYLLAFCSKKTDPIDPSVFKRIEQSDMKGRYYNKDIHASAFSLPNFIKVLVETTD